MSSPSAVPTDSAASMPPQGEDQPISYELAHADGSLSIDLTRSGPPPEVLEQMANADAINSRLRASGRELSFSLSADGCSLQIELRDRHGQLLRVLSPAEAMEIAAGEDLEED
jgi:hypothetical protein